MNIKNYNDDIIMLKLKGASNIFVHIILCICIIYKFYLKNNFFK
jgi:hypothetical protein